MTSAGSVRAIWTGAGAGVAACDGAGPEEAGNCKAATGAVVLGTSAAASAGSSPRPVLRTGVSAEVSDVRVARAGTGGEVGAEAGVGDALPARLLSRRCALNACRSARVSGPFAACAAGAAALCDACPSARPAGARPESKPAIAGEEPAVRASAMRGSSRPMAEARGKIPRLDAAACCAGVRRRI